MFKRLAAGLSLAALGLAVGVLPGTASATENPVQDPCAKLTTDLVAASLYATLVSLQYPPNPEAIAAAKANLEAAAKAFNDAGCVPATPGGVLLPGS